MTPSLFMSLVTLALIILLDSSNLVSGKRRFKHSFINCRSGYMVQYKMTVHTTWSKEVFPRMYPLYRPHAQWSNLVGRTHGQGFSLWEEGVNATKSVQVFAEEGDSRYLDADSKQGYNDVLDTFTAPPVPKGVGSTSAMVTLDGDHRLLSFIMRIIPSPDWFIGLSSEDMCAHGRWRSLVNIDLRPLDAGTDQGLTFTAPNWPHEPYIPISRITNHQPDHPASPFYYPQYEELPRLAYVELELLTQYRHRRTFAEIAEEDEEYEEQQFTADEGSNSESNEVQTQTPGSSFMTTGYTFSELNESSPEVTTGNSEDGTGSTEDYSAQSTGPGQKSTQGKTYSTGVQRDETSTVVTKWGAARTSSMTSRQSLRMPRPSMMRDLSVAAARASHKRRSSRAMTDGEPSSDVSKQSIDEPQFKEVADALPSTKSPGSKVTHCKVTDWTEWTPCSQTCGFGKRFRSRDVISVPSFGGANCPPLREEALCGSMRTCKWSHFSFLSNDGPKRRRMRGRRGYRARRY